MDVREALTDHADERAAVAEGLRPRTSLERLYGSRFEATIEREVAGHLADDAIDTVRRRVEDTFAINEGGAVVRELERTSTRVVWLVYTGQRPTSDSGPINTGHAVVLDRGPARTRITAVVRLGAPWMLLASPLLALMVFGILRSVTGLVGGIAIAAFLWWSMRPRIREWSRIKLRSALLTMPTLCDAVRDASRPRE
jgi:hypothetical protein